MYYAYGIEQGQQATRLAQWEQVAKSGVIPDALRDRPDCPAEALHIWETHVALTNCGKAGYPEIAAYQSLTGITLTPVELDMLARLERVRLHSG